MEMINKTGVHFVFHLLPQSVPSSNASGDMVLDVPSIRTQIRGIQLLPAIRYYRQGKLWLILPPPHSIIISWR